MNNAITAAEFDPGFGIDGFVRPGSPGEDNMGMTTAALPDGRMYVAFHSGENYTLARLTEMGRLDTTFGDQGVIEGRFPRDRNTVNSRSSVFQIIDLPGKVLVVGEVYLYYGDDLDIFPAMARYTDTGVLDNSFCEDGFRVFKQAVLQVFCTTGRPSKGQLALEDSAARELPYRSFGGGDCLRVGRRLFALLNGKIQHDDGVLFESGGVLAFDVEGDVDREFGSDGIALLKPITFESSVLSACASETGLYFGGVRYTPDFTYVESFVARMSPAGVIDQHFGTGGFALLGRRLSPLGLFFASEQALIAVETAAQVCLRLDDGAFDPQFNDGKRLEVSFAGLPIYGRRGIALDDGYLTVGRYDKGGAQLVIEKYQLDGTRDTSFGQAGVKFASTDRMSDCAVVGRSISLDKAGRAVVAGFHGGRAAMVPVFARLLL